MKKKFILILLISSILTGCSETKTVDTTNETSEIIESTEQLETEDVKESTAVEVAETENELIKEDFEAEYKGYIINAQTSEKDIKEALGVPDDFEINNNGYISTQYPNQIWQLNYPNFTDESDIRVIFYTNIDTEVTAIKKVHLQKVPTSRGVMSGDSAEKVYEAYGLPNEEKIYNNIDGLLEVNYIKDDQKLSFVIDEESKTVKYIYINYFIDEDNDYE